MPKLIRTGRTFGLLNRRLVTDAGGAPCCCGGGLCQCDPAYLLLPFRYHVCGGSNNTYQPFIYEPTPPARLVTFEVAWNIRFDEFQFRFVPPPLGGPLVPERIARLFTSEGRATVCLFRTSGQNSYQYVVARAASGETRIVVGDVPVQIDESVTYDETNIPLRVTPFSQGIGWVPAIFGQDAAETPNYQPFGCDDTTTYSRTSGARTVNATRTQTFRQVLGSGSFGLRTTGQSQSNNQEFPSLRRTANDTTITWSYTLDPCDGSTEPSELGGRPGGCAGCGDASQLQIL